MSTLAFVSTPVCYSTTSAPALATSGTDNWGNAVYIGSNTGAGTGATYSAVTSCGTGTIVSFTSFTAASSWG